MGGALNVSRGFLLFRRDLPRPKQNDTGAFPCNNRTTTNDTTIYSVTRAIGVSHIVPKNVSFDETLDLTAVFNAVFFLQFLAKKSSL